MLTKFEKFVRDIRISLWFKPTVSCLFAAAAALAISGIDESLPAGIAAALPVIDDGATKDLLRLAAGGMLTVTTVTLSVTMLVLNLTSNQASPRAVPELMADPVTQNALSTFLATFVFAVTALALFGFQAVSGSGVTLTFGAAVCLGVWAIRYLVHWMHHVAAASKLNNIMAKVYGLSAGCLENYLSDDAGGDREARGQAGDERPPEDGETVCARNTGYVQLINIHGMTQTAEKRDVDVVLLVSEGDFVHRETPLMRVYGDNAADAETQDRLRRNVAVGQDRTMEDDPCLGIEILSEIACRALSPGLNDPQSAIACIDYLSALLAQAGRVPPDAYPAALVGDGRIKRIVIGFDQLLIRAFRPVIRDGGGQAEVAKRMFEVLEDLGRTVAPGHLGVIADETARAADAAQSQLSLQADKDSVAEAAKAVGAVIKERRAKS